jgi:Flp pilus assembly protein protease CpaA
MTERQDPSPGLDKMANMLLEITLLFLVLAVSLYDLRTGRVPNWVTWPLLCVGILASFPGTPAGWLLSLLIFLAWKWGWLSAGDAKLWIALLWVIPSPQPAAFFATFLLTGLLQILARKFKHQPLTGLRSPGAWRTLPFLLWSLYVH